MDTSINPKDIPLILNFFFIMTLLNVNCDFDVSVSNDVAKCALLRDRLDLSTNKNMRYIMK